MLPESVPVQRKTLSEALSTLSVLSHSDLDWFLMEIGLSRMDAPNSGSKTNRFSSLGEFLLANRDATNEDGELYSVLFVKKANELKKAEEETRRRFEGADDRAPWRKQEQTVEKKDTIMAVPTTTSSQQIGIQNTKVFLVHGRDEMMLNAVARTIGKLGLKEVILREAADNGWTVIEKFEKNAEVGFAVILLSGDDFGGLKGGPSQSRARQNVILEWGFFVGKLGRQRVIALKRDDIELPSDLVGLVWVPFDDLGAWKQRLVKELKGCGYEVDANDLL